MITIGIINKDIENNNNYKWSYNREYNFEHKVCNALGW